MDTDTLQETAAYVNQLLMEYYACDAGVKNVDGLAFLLADLMHYCDFHNLNYNAVVNAAKWHYVYDSKGASQV